jgi:hypothetical protein
MRSIQARAVTVAVVMSLAAGCGKTASYKVVNPMQTPDDGPAPTEDQPETDKGRGKTKRKKATPSMGDFFETHVAHQEAVRRDDGQVLMANAAGDVAVAGVTRSRLDRTANIEPSLGGDLFFARYNLREGWYEEPIQVTVTVPDGAIPVDPENPEAEPKPLAEPLVVAKGGRLLESGKALVVGELVGTGFDSAQLHRDETKGAARNVFLSIFGVGDSGMTKALSYGISGQNTVVGAAAGGDATILIAGHTTSGLLPDGSSDVSSEVSTPSNYVAELTDDGDIVRFFAWNDHNDDNVKEDVRAITANRNTAFVAMERDNGGGVFVKGLRLHAHSQEFIDLPSRPVCAEQSKNATSVRVTSIDASDTELVVAVEIDVRASSDGTVLPCFEVFGIKDLGTLTSEREVVYLPEMPTLAGTTRANMVQDGRVMLVRSRENTSSQGRVGVVVTFLYERPALDKNYVGRAWPLSRPDDWYGSDSVHGLRREVRAVVWPEGSNQDDIVWVLSNDVTETSDGRESLVQIGTYAAVPQTKK